MVDGRIKRKCLDGATIGTGEINRLAERGPLEQTTPRGTCLQGFLTDDGEIDTSLVHPLYRAVGEAEKRKCEAAAFFGEVPGFFDTQAHLRGDIAFHACSNK